MIKGKKTGPLSYTKRYLTPEAMWREYNALIACKGEDVQVVLRIDAEKSRICFEFDFNAIPLNHFSSMDAPLFISLLPCIARAIQGCHKKGWVHGDIKPSNILYLKENGGIRLIDFGASYPIGTSRNALKTWQLTPSLASPAQRSGDGFVEPNDDWYALNKLTEQVRSFLK